MRRLTELIDNLSPFLDSQGRAYCYIKSQTADGDESETLGVVAELDSEPITSLLSYQFDANHLIVPSRSVIRQALDVARGKLWATQPKQFKVRPAWAATIKAIVLSSLSGGGFTGPASKVLEHLNEVVARDSQLIADLPRSADHMGVVLNRIGLLLRQKNIELFRPPRRDRERLWSWRLLVSNDHASDTPDTTTHRVSGNSGGKISRQDPRSDNPDTSERGNLLARLSGILHGATNDSR